MSVKTSAHFLKTAENYFFQVVSILFFLFFNQKVRQESEKQGYLGLTHRGHGRQNFKVVCILLDFGEDFENFGETI